jgi:hypothetical protein
MMREEPTITGQQSAPKGLTVKVTVEEESSQEEGIPLVDTE